MGGSVAIQALQSRMADPLFTLHESERVDAKGDFALDKSVTEG